MSGADPIGARQAGSASDSETKLRTVTPGSRGLKALWGTLAAGVCLAACPAIAAPAEQIVAGMTLGTFEVIQGAVFAGVLGAALLSAFWLISERGRISADNLDLRGRIAELSSALQRSEAMLNLKDQRTIVWMKDATRPEIIGSLGLLAGVPEERAQFLAFGRWLTSGSATAVEHAIAELRTRGTPFELIAETRHGQLLEIQGRTSGPNAVARFLSFSDAQQAHAELRSEHDKLQAEFDTVRALLNALPMPFWLRERDGRLRWVNRAYGESVEAEQTVAVQEGREFLPSQARDGINRRHLDKQMFNETVSTVISGDRRLFTVTDVATGELSSGIATDRTEIETVREELRKVQRSHSQTLDQLTTAVAIFDASEKLRFYNQAFQKLWDLEAGFLESAPSNGTLIDRLRSDGKLAEQPEWRRWKDGILAAYRAVETQEDWWHLPDGRTLRVLANPQPTGGLTWVFENMTEKMDLESRYNSAVQVQSETLDNLAEGVAVFGPDGRLRLSNPAFARLWGLPSELTMPGVHIATIRGAGDLVARESPWASFVSDVTSFADERNDRHGEAEITDGSVLRYAVIHLPNGQVMITFVDITDTVNVQRALKDKNDALQAADQLKNDFVQHVSYELRSPLTNIIGFTELLTLPATGPLVPKQREYLDHIGSSSAVLLTIVNDILDLATVDAGIMELDLEDINVDTIVRQSTELVAEWLRENDITLETDLSAAPQHIRADENRLRQVLFNLLSNAVNYAPEGSTISISCRSQPGWFEFAVRDEGPGIPPEVLDTVYRRFESRANGGRRRGAGLGLSIVKSFVELHGGEVVIETTPGRGTVVVCRFPAEPSAVRPAAE